MTELLKAQVVKVGIADMNIIKPPNTIRTSGLGSCVGVVIYDEKKKLQVWPISCCLTLHSLNLDRSTLPNLQIRR